jgi:hypothetical protein
MGATPIAGCAITGLERPLPRGEGAPATAASREALAWGYLVHPSLMPTVFARRERASEDNPGKEVAARKT